MNTFQNIVQHLNTIHTPIILDDDFKVLRSVWTLRGTSTNIIILYHISFYSTNGTSIIHICRALINLK